MCSLSSWILLLFAVYEGYHLHTCVLWCINLVSRFSTSTLNGKIWKMAGRFQTQSSLILAVFSWWVEEVLTWFVCECLGRLEAHFARASHPTFWQMLVCVCETVCLFVCLIDRCFCAPRWRQTAWASVWHCTPSSVPLPPFSNPAPLRLWAPLGPSLSLAMAPSQVSSTPHCSVCLCHTHAEHPHSFLHCTYLSVPPNDPSPHSMQGALGACAQGW